MMRNLERKILPLVSTDTICRLLAFLLVMTTFLTGQAGAAENAAATVKPDSVLERFRTFTGERTVAGLTALFDLPADATLRQLPAIAISDGTTAVVIATRIAAATEGQAVNFALEGARQLSLKRLKANEWEMRALPARGGWNASLVVVNGSEVKEFSLTVAPPLPAGVKLSEQDFNDYLGRPVDLNNDGRTDFLDDYIYTANYLTKKRQTGRDLKARKERALRRTLAVEPPPPAPEYDPKMFDEPPAK